MATSDEEIFNAIQEGKLVFRQDDKFLDVFVHYDGEHYTAWIDGKKIKLDEQLLAEAINKELAGMKGLKGIRLFSCSDWKAGSYLAKYIDKDLPLYTSNKPVDLYLDANNNITAIDGGDWKKFSKTKEEDFSPTWDNKPNSSGKGRVMRMGVDDIVHGIHEQDQIIQQMYKNGFYEIPYDNKRFREAFYSEKFQDINGKEGKRLVLGDDESLSYSYDIETMQGVLDIHMHGEPKKMFAAFTNGTEKSYTVQELADIINTKYPGYKKIRMFVCYGESFAKELSSLTKADVISANAKIEFIPNKEGIRFLLSGNIYVTKYIE